eukprot:1299967-Rhodomonas_salina.1
MLAIVEAGLVLTALGVMVTMIPAAIGVCLQVLAASGTEESVRSGGREGFPPALDGLGGFWVPNPLLQPQLGMLWSYLVCHRCMLSVLLSVLRCCVLSDVCSAFLLELLGDGAVGDSTEPRHESWRPPTGLHSRELHIALVFVVLVCIAVFDVTVIFFIRLSFLIVTITLKIMIITPTTTG